MKRPTSVTESTAEDSVRMDYLKAALDFERDLATRRGAPLADRLPLLGSRTVFELVVAILLAMGVAGMSLLGNFLVFNIVLHWTF
jgi:hypothetical protein